MNKFVKKKNQFWALFLWKIKKIFEIKSFLVVVLIFAAISAIFAISLSVSLATLGAADELSTNFYVWLTLKFACQIIFIGFIILILVAKLFRIDVDNKELSVYTRAGVKTYSWFINRIFMITLIVWIIIGVVALGDFLIMLFNPYNFFINKAIFMYLFYFCFSFGFSAVTILLLQIFKISVVFVISIPLLVIISGAGFFHSFSSKTDQKNFAQQQAQAEWELANTFNYYKVLTSNNLYDEMKSFSRDIYEEESSNAKFNEYFTMRQTFETEALIQKAINDSFLGTTKYTYNNKDLKIQNGQPFYDFNSFNYSSYRHDYQFSKSLNYLGSELKNNSNPDIHKYFPIINFLENNLNSFEPSFFLVSSDDYKPEDDLFARGDNYSPISEEVWKNYNNNYGSFLANWFILNFNKALFSMSDNLISYIYKYDNLFLPSIKANLIFNPLTQISQMSFGTSKNPLLDNTFNLLDFSLHSTFPNTFIKIDYKPGTNDLLKKITTKDQKMIVKNGYQPDFLEDDGEYSSYYNLIEKIKVVKIVPIWVLFLLHFIIAIGFYGLGYVLLKIKILKL
ncbi:hypothetical protein SSABA_v1c09080 [Spiroplasma sabaudiense Ar-1343]|uniref:Uncharacterized protein n=1 Tax=Spiroplasma sabaudiense Ar-1343 TaxID=1276257 RepID=W6AB78_9MOLU|nr:hypothetical protein [Spiroplasma sabaudiense]AHI54307.1 hypothetical protein SSABA_v1c09080 [Spiroplasma sabaudiense Ar-1343]